MGKRSVPLLSTKILRILLSYAWFVLEVKFAKLFNNIIESLETLERNTLSTKSSPMDCTYRIFLLSFFCHHCSLTPYPALLMLRISSGLPCVKWWCVDLTDPRILVSIDPRPTMRDRRSPRGTIPRPALAEIQILGRNWIVLRINLAEVRCEELAQQAARTSRKKWKTRKSSDVFIPTVWKRYLEPFTRVAIHWTCG